MSADRDPSDDLLIRARRGMLLDDEERRLREALALSSETRLLFDAGCAFDREAPVLPGDDARIERMLRAVQERERRRRRAPVSSRPHWPTLAIGMLVGAAAVAAGEVSKSLLWPAPFAPASAAEAAIAPEKRARSGSSGSNGEAPFSNVPQSPASAVADPSSRVVAPTREESTAPAPSTRSAARTVRRSPTPSAPNPVKPVEPNAREVSARGASDPPVARSNDTIANGTSETRASTAGELFRSANQARMQGDSARAIAAYLRLESEFPNSAEALIARLSLGMLYLHAGQASLALEQFQSYRTLGHGPTLGEALWGESLALHQLGRRSEERDVLAELLARFPDSVYASAARKRLSEP